MATKVFSAEKYQKVCTTNKALLNDFLVELRSNRKKPSTIEQYGCDLRMVLCHIYDDMDNANLLEMNRKDFRNIKMWYLTERNVSPARCNRVLSAIHSMLNYAEDDDDYEYEFNKSQKVRGVTKEGVKEIVFLEDDQIKRLRDYLIENEKFRMLALLDLLYDSGGRRNEILQIKKEGLLDRNYTNIVNGKGGKKFPLIYFSRSKESVKLYLDQRGEDDLEELWVIGDKDHRRPASYARLYDWVMEMRSIISKIEGKPLMITPHSFRHSALQNMKNGTHYICKELNKEGFTLEELKVYAHHNDTGTTEGYLKINDNDILASMFGIEL